MIITIVHTLIPNNV